MAFAPTLPHRINPWIRNSKLGDLYLSALRADRSSIARVMELLLGSQIRCAIPRQLYIPHPYGIVIGKHCKLGEEITIMQQVTLGGKDPWCTLPDTSNEYPTICLGAYLGAGSKILGNINVGAWSVIGANAVVTKNVPEYTTVVGYNRHLGAKPPRGLEPKQ